MLSLNHLSLHAGLIAGSLSFALAGIVFDQTCGVAPANNPILSDVVNMATAAKVCEILFSNSTVAAHVDMEGSSQNYMDNVQSNEQSQDKKDHWDAYRVYAMFNIIFDAKHPDAHARWNQVRNNMAALANLHNNQPDVYVICDDSTFWSITPSNGNPTTFNAPDGTYDHRPQGATTCADFVNGKNLIGYRFDFNSVDYIVLCTKQWKFPLHLGLISYSEGTDIMDTQTWSTTFFHEIMHVLQLGQIGDLGGGSQANGERYGWSDIQQVRSTYSTENPDSSKFFAMALSMEEWLWHTGTAVSFNAEYQKLAQIKFQAQQQSQKTPNPDQTKTTFTPIDNLGLPLPAPGPWQ